MAWREFSGTFSSSGYHEKPHKNGPSLNGVLNKTTVKTVSAEEEMLGFFKTCIRFWIYVLFLMHLQGKDILANCTTVKEIIPPPKSKGFCPPLSPFLWKQNYLLLPNLRFHFQVCAELLLGMSFSVENCKCMLFASLSRLTPQNWFHMLMGTGFGPGK